MEQNVFDRTMRCLAISEGNKIPLDSHLARFFSSSSSSFISFVRFLFDFSHIQLGRNSPLIQKKSLFNVMKEEEKILFTFKAQQNEFIQQQAN